MPPCDALSGFQVVVPRGHLWVMGDNRADSADSRAHMGDPGGGFVDAKLVVGEITAILEPQSRARDIHVPATFAEIPNP